MEVEEIEFGSRKLSGLAAWLIPLVAGCWSIFQLALADLILLDTLYVRCIHLAFAIALVFLSFPFTAKPAPIRWFELLLALLGSTAALYLAMDYVGISERQGMPFVRDVVIGVTLIGLLLEAARRALGPALPIIALTFILSSLFASSLPAFLASRDVSLHHLVSKLTLSTEGIYGIPLRVSSDTVFLFVLFGAMLDRAGGGRYFVDLAESLLGRFRGGPAKAAVLASGLTGMVSGSSIANTVTTGTFTIPLMKRCGYPATKAAAIEVAASTNGQLMPPIMGAAAFIIAEYCHLPYLEVVRAAFVPAILSYLTLIFITHLEACKLGLEGASAKDLPPFWSTLLRGIHFWIPLTFLIYQLVIARRSPTAAAYQAILALGLVMITRQIIIDWRTPGKALRTATRMLWEALVAGGRNMMGIGVAVAAAGIIVGVVSMGLGGKVTEIIDVLSGGHLYGVLVIAALVSLVLGMGLPTTANYIVMANLTVPAIIALSSEANVAIPLIAAHLFCFYFGILADDTPPVGLAAFAAAAIAKSDPIRTGIQGFVYDIRTALLPFVFVFNPKLLLIGVEGMPAILFVLGSGLVGMFAFASLTQGYLLARNYWVHNCLLAAIVALSLRPELFTEDPIWSAILGATLFGTLCLWQLRTSTKSS